MGCSSKAFLFICLSLAILSIIISSQVAAFSEIPPVSVLPEAGEAANDGKDAAAAKEAAEGAIDKSKDAAEHIINSMAQTNIVTIGLTVVSVVTSCLAFADILLLNY